MTPGYIMRCWKSTAETTTTFIIFLAYLKFHIFFSFQGGPKGWPLAWRGKGARHWKKKSTCKDGTRGCRAGMGGVLAMMNVFSRTKTAEGRTLIFPSFGQSFGYRGVSRCEYISAHKLRDIGLSLPHRFFPVRRIVGSYQPPLSSHLLDLARASFGVCTNNAVSSGIVGCHC